MRVSARQLQKFGNAPSAVPAPVQPPLTLAEEVILLSLDAPRSAVRGAVALVGRAHAGSLDYRGAVHSLRDAGLLERSGPLGSLTAARSAKVSERHDRVLAVIRRAAPPTGADAELLVLLADAQALALERADHLHARIRIASIGEAERIPPAVELLCRQKQVDSMDELAAILLPAERDLKLGTFDPGISRGVTGVGP